MGAEDPKPLAGAMQQFLGDRDVNQGGVQVTMAEVGPEVRQLGLDIDVFPVPLDQPCTALNASHTRAAMPLPSFCPAILGQSAPPRTPESGGEQIRTASRRAVPRDPDPTQPRIVAAELVLD